MLNGFYLNPEAHKTGKQRYEDLDGSSFFVYNYWKYILFMDREKLDDPAPNYIVDYDEVFEDDDD